MKILITGGAGFIGSNCVRYLLAQHADDEVVNLDALTYAGNLENLADVAAQPRYRFVRGDIADRAAVDDAMRGVEAVVNFAAESHVDRSIDDPAGFLRTNVAGTLVLLEAARQAGVHRFVQVSTDEVYGSLGPAGRFDEASPLRPSSPYSASKAAADLLALSFWTTYRLPVIVTRCSNNFGPYQFPEKVIPLFVTNALADQPLPLYGDGLNVRDWIYVDDHCAALDLVLRRGQPGEVYNIGGGNECTNRELTEGILRELGKPLSLIRHVTDRPGHDRRYAIDASKLRQELGWQPARTFAEALRQTVVWYRDHSGWWRRVKSGDYRTYYERMYGNRLRTASRVAVP
ncbi:MAG TPA: dTDP-glucose 4,6-dehydratase [Candidatus Acidoferrales bacterium]|nr:dTDP-glucose 4,6-dehydratase [Candidatus Acidoferrales bacterium]